MTLLENRLIELGTLTGHAEASVSVERLEADLPLDMRLTTGPDGPRVAAGYPGLMRLSAFKRPLGRLRITFSAVEETR